MSGGKRMEDMKIRPTGESKKSYEPPVVQVYGTLAELTAGSAPSPTHTNRDGGAYPSNRT
jgi:hypothetical protein